MSAAPVIGVLALQGDVREHVTALTSCGARSVLVRRASELVGLDGLVLPGGESTTIGRLLQIFEVLTPLQDAIAAGLPTYGSCAGMVLLAGSVLDGLAGQPLLGGLDIVVRRNAFGRQVDSFETDLVMTGIPGEPLKAVFIRAPWVDSVGPTVQILATVGGQGASAGSVVAVRQGNVLATSFHPELTGDARVHELFVTMVKETQL